MHSTIIAVCILLAVVYLTRAQTSSLDDFKRFQSKQHRRQPERDYVKRQSAKLSQEQKETDLLEDVLSYYAKFPMKALKLAKVEERIERIHSE